VEVLAALATLEAELAEVKQRSGLPSATGWLAPAVRPGRRSVDFARPPILAIDRRRLSLVSGPRSRSALAAG
jgi:hypothetical protein